MIRTAKEALAIGQPEREVCGTGKARPGMVESPEVK